MSLCTTAELRSVLGIGALYTDAQLQEVCDAADVVLLPMLWQNKDYNIGHSRSASVGTLYFDHPVHDIYYVGQSINIAGNGSHFNGQKTITSVGDETITVTLTGQPSDATYHPVNPYGVITAETYVDYALDPAVQVAAQLIAVDIWQARNSANGGMVSPDGTPTPYRMGVSMLSRVRGLIAHAMSPGAMLG